MATQQPLVLMMAGGTGGHVYPALAVATELLSRGYRVEWVGTARGLEHRVVPAAGITLHCLLVRGVRGKSILHKVLGLLFLLLASLQALWLVLRLAPRSVVGMGGYVAGPAGVAAWLLRKPLLIHEQNAVAGTTNRMLAPMATKIVAGFPGAFKDDIEYTVLGNPVRRELVAAGAACHYDYAGQRPLRLLVLGGSLGARPINNIIPGAVRQVTQQGDAQLEVWHQAGDAHADVVRDSYGALLDQRVRVAPFIENMAEAYAWADLVICRAGALTVAELSAAGVPAIFVPFPSAVDDHQTANAQPMADAGAATVVQQSELSDESLAGVLKSWLGSRDALLERARKSRLLARPDALSRITSLCLESAGVTT